MSKLVLFCPYQKTGGGIVERAIQQMERTVRAAVAAGDVNEADKDSWIKEICWEVNTMEGSNESSAFENLYGVPPRTPLRMAIPIALRMNESERRNWQTTLRSRNEDKRVRSAFKQHERRKKRGDDMIDKASEFKKGTKIWVRREGTNVSALDPSRWQKGTLIKQRENERSAVVRLDGQQKNIVRRLDVIRRRYDITNDVPDDEAIEQALQGNNVEDLAMDYEDGVEMNSEEEEEVLRVEETSQEDGDDASEEDNGGEAKEEDDSQFQMTIPSSQSDEGDGNERPPMQEQIQGKRRKNESSGINGRKVKKVRFSETPLTQKEVVVIRDKNNDQAYLSLLNEETGKFILMKRTASKKKREYHPVWWKYNGEGKMIQKAQKKRPGSDWELWECSQEVMTEEARFGRILEDNYRLPHEWDNKYLEIAGTEKRKKRRR
jgi:hypothetical protein